ncbi:amidinotransferase [Thermoactinospora rubra]|uniref:amidinotransferase n=1 Tax=Thermoactinospora rubra TaxID=1088767 RepID=UPI000A12274E|nr:amidinotransferase [Thermoactinospora rubra]
MTLSSLAHAPREVPAPSKVVSSYTEWDPLEEVVVGRLAGGVFPTWQESMRGTMPPASWRIFQEQGGRPFPQDLVDAAEEELDGLARTLEAEGVKVVRPEPADHAREFATPHWKSAGGLYSAMPRDHLMVVGDTIVEAPMSWRCRYFEGEAFRPLIKSYFRQGARWLQAPRPQLTDELFATGHDEGDTGGWMVTEFEPVFDAADFMRFGRDIVVQQSHVTNDFGIQWLRRALGDGFRVHTIEVNDPHAMHIDATILPLAPGKLLVNPERYVPNDLFRDWEIRKAPPPTLPESWPMYFCSPWVSMNMLSLDERTVVVERQEEPMIELLTDWGFRCIPVDFRHVYTFGGSFHCVTVDVRRRGGDGRYLNLD